MKLRIKGNSIRLRLSQREVRELATTGRCQDSIDFGQSKLSYLLQSSPEAEFSTKYESQKITISIPYDEGQKWANTSQVSLKYTAKINETEKLLVLIEKDFKCLTSRPYEDESDLYENPMDTHSS